MARFFLGTPLPRVLPLVRTWLFAMACTAGCAACVSTPLPDLDSHLPARWRHGTTGVVPAPGQQQWWRAFADPGLDRVVDDALSTNLEIAQAAARLRSARALHEGETARFRPNLAFRTADPIDPDASASYVVAGFDSLWELGFFGRVTAIHRIARGQLDGASADLRDVRVSVAGEVARQWILMRSAQQRETVLAAVRDLRQQHARLVGDRVALHLESPQQLASAQAELARADAALYEPREAQATAAQALAVLLGRAEPDPEWMRPAPLPRLQDVSIASTPADLLRSRPDIARSEAAVLGAAGELGLAKAERYPSIAIGGSLMVSTSEVERTSKNTGAIGSLGPVIDIPLFDWGIRRATARSKAELLQAAAYAYRRTVLSAAGEVETALASLEQQRLREQAQAQALAANDRIVQSTLRRRKLGLASGVDVALSGIERAQAALDLDAARTDRALQYIALCKALGGDLAPPSGAQPAGAR